MTVEEIFLAAVEKPPADREAYLAEACGGDAGRRAGVEALLRSHEEAGSLLEQPLFQPGPTVDQSPPADRPGAVIGPYKLLQQIGEGGMGTVFMAEQTEPVKRKVALKVIKAGMDSRQVIARFEAERQALALMDHVNIARVFDGGTTENGRPYFVMELVHGVPITKYCDDNHLTPRERLELFVPVCQAIQHAHQKGIIHRDIKPSNVMVTLYDGKPVPKVIDFGVAKATEQKLTERTLFTQYGTMVGTLEYMSPEQAEMSALGIDTRSDIYSLGVLLYELLTGSTPLSRKRMKEAAFGEILRMLKEEEPPKPSTRLSDSGEALASISAQRHMEPAKLTKLVRGELDWIVMKTLEKDRNRRYETANAFAADVQRYLADEPVQACPPSARYRLKKLIRRHKGPVLAASLVLLALVVGLVGLGWGLIKADRSRQVAERREREAQAAAGAEALANQSAQKRLAQIVKGNEILGSIFKDLDPEAETTEGKPLRVLLGERLDAAVKQLEGEAIGDPPAVARLQLTLGWSLLGLGYPEKAIDLFSKARATCTTHLGSDHPDTLHGMHYLAISYTVLGRHADALKLHDETLALRTAKLGPDHPDTLASLNQLAISYADLSRHAEALKLFEETLALHKATLGPEHPRTLTIMNNLATACERLGRHPDALKLREETLPLHKARLGPNHPDTLTTMNNLANSYSALGRYADALQLHDETLALRKARLGFDHPRTLESMYNLANTHTALGRGADALKLHEETLARRKAKLGLDHLQTLESMNNLANSYAALGRHADALKLDEESLAIRKAKLGPDHPKTLSSMNNLASRYAALGRPADALKLHEETLALRKAKLGADHPQTLSSMNNLANRYEDLGRHAEALKLREDTLQFRKVKLGPNHPDTLSSMGNLAVSLVRLDRSEEAAALIDDCLIRAAGKMVKPRLIPDLLDTRLRAFQKQKDAAGCVETARRLEAFQQTDAGSLYQSAFFRAVCAAMVEETDKTTAGKAKAKEQADQAMAWLHKAVAAGYKDVAHMKQDKDLDALRGREDFKKLMTALEAGRRKPK